MKKVNPKTNKPLASSILDMLHTGRIFLLHNYWHWYYFCTFCPVAFGQVRQTLASDAMPFRAGWRFHPQIREVKIQYAFIYILHTNKIITNKSWWVNQNYFFSLLILTFSFALTEHITNYLFLNFFSYISSRTVYLDFHRAPCRHR
jgi:hypothetical protein